MMDARFGSLFSGIGGFDLAFERAGMECAWQCEIDKNAQSVLRKHFGVKLYDDVRTITRDNAEPVDLICGGFPCQDLSVAGKRAGLAGERSGLWFEFHRVIAELQPRWVVIENVPGLLSSDGGRDMGILIGGLAQLGYGWAYRVLDAQFFGVAQRRRRVFIVASLGNYRSAQVLFEPESGERDTPPSREAGEGTARDVVGSLDSGGSGGRNAHGGAWPGTTVQSASAGHAFPVAFDGRNLTESEPSPTLQAKKSGGYSLNYTPMVMAHGQANAEIFEDKSPTLQLNHEQPIVSTWTIRGGKEGGGKESLAAEDKAMTLGGQPQWMGVRRLTPTECERLQGFPDGWTAGQSDSARYRQLGNAVAVPVVEWIGKRIMEQIDGR